MATDHDVAFLRVLIRQGLLEPAHAGRCIEAIDQHPEQTIAQVVGRLGFVDAARLAEVASALDQDGVGAGAAGDDDAGVAESWGDPQQSHELAVYELGARLGRGPIGTAYAGRRRGDGLEVVIKVLSKKFNGHPDLLGRVAADVRSFFGVEHPHLGPTLALGAVRDRTTVVFGRLAGPTLAAELRRRQRLPAPEAARAACQVAQGLAELHGRGLCCGDVRASKVYLTERGAVLADLGLARGASAAGGFGRHRLAFGHPAYLSPELRGALGPTPAGDVYALGVLLYEALCGRLPFQGTPDEMLRLHAESPIPPPPTNAGVSVALAGLLLRTTAKQPQARPDAASLARALHGLSEQRTSILPPKAPAQAMSLGEWSTASQQDVSTRSGVWSVGRIQQAAAVGPSDLAAAAPSQSARFTRSWGASVLMKAASLEDIESPAPAPAAPAPTTPAPSAAAVAGAPEQTLRFEAVLPARPSGRLQKAPGGGDALRLILEEGGQLRSFDLTGDEHTIGRTAENSVKIADAQSSRRHCKLRRTAAGWVVEDLASRNGTKVNGVLLASERMLSAGDRIEVGESVVHFREKRAPARPDLDAKPLMRAVGNLAVGERLGGGPVGTTYDGTLEGRRAAVKVVSSRFTSHAETLAKLVERVRAATVLDHPRIVRVLDVAEYEGRTVIITDRKPGNSLRETLAFEKRLAPDEVAERVKEIAQALEVAAARGLHHGDVRPAKVLLDGAGQACLADFGLAEAACLAGGFGAAGVPFGHPTYLAPEVIQERLTAPTARTDVYALGVLFYELLTGQPPFRGAKAQEVLLQHLEAPVPPPPQDVEVPRPLAELLLRMLAKDPARRPASAAEVRELLERRAAAPVKGAQAGLLEDALQRTVEAEEFDPRSTLVSSVEWSTLADSSVHALDALPPIPLLAPPGPSPAASASARRPSQPAPAVAPPAGASTSARVAAAAAPPVSPSSSVLAEPLSTASGEAAPMPSATASARPAGPALVPVAPEADRVKLLATWVVLVGSLVGMAALSLRSCDAPPRRPPPPSTTPPVARTEPPPPPPGPSADEKARAARHARAVDDLVRNVDDALHRSDPVEAARLWAEAPAEVKDWPAERPRLIATHEKLREAIRTEVLKHKPAVEALLKSGDLTRASLALERLRGFAADEPAFFDLDGRVQLAVRARQKQLELLKPDKVVERKVLSDRLAAINLRAWPKGVTLLDNGAVAIGYAPGDPALGDDLTFLKGRKGAQDGRGLLVSATEPVLLALRLPFARVLDVQVEVALLSEPPAGGRVVVLAGLGEGPARRSHGVAWGITPVELSAGVLQVVNTRGLPRLPVQKPLRLELALGSAGQPGRSFVSGHLLELDSRQRSEGGRAVVPDEDLRGWVGIYLEHVDVRLQGLEVRGLLDVAALGL